MLFTGYHNGIRIIIDTVLKYYQLDDAKTKRAVGWHCFDEINNELYKKIEREIDSYNAIFISSDATTGRD